MDNVMMPQMGYDMKEGRLIKWLKGEGDEITTGEDIAEIETDKAIIPMPSPSGGILRKIITPEGEMVPVGTVLGFIGTLEEEIPSNLTSTPVENSNIPENENVTELNTSEPIEEPIIETPKTSS